MIIPVLVAITFLTGTGIVLSLLLIIAEKKILNYGLCTIDINSGQRALTLSGGNSLLASLAENGIFIPSACGGRGSCAYCKVRILAGGGVIGPVEEPYLTPQDRQNRIRLACQVKVRNDLQIEIPRELFTVKKFNAVVSRKRALTHDIFELRLQLIDPPVIDFIAGQYVQLESEEYKGRDAVMRAYSMSSVPSDREVIELIIRKVPEGIMTTWIFDYLKEGQKIRFSGPYGEFFLRDTQAPIIFIAGGSGMSPIYSIIRDMIAKNMRREAIYFFGALTQADLFYLDELHRIEQQQAWFRFIPSLSREPEGTDWGGERGIITQTLTKFKPDCRGHEAYLCGSPGLIEASNKTLIAAGIDPACIYYDKFA